MNEERVIEYVQARTPDKMRLANLITRAKGPERTMAQFADLCGVSASSLSRAVNGKITKPLSEDLIRAIVNNAAEDIPLEIIMNANGMVEKEMFERHSVGYQNNYMRRQEQINRENIAKNIISTELLNRGRLIRYFMRLPMEEGKKSKFHLRRISSFALWVESNPSFMWNFILYPQQLDEDPREIRYMHMRVMDRMSSYFLMDAWEPELLEGVRTTIVFVDKAFYDSQVDLLKNAIVNSEMSLLLLDTENETVVEEFVIPRKNGEEYHYIFKEEVPARNDFDYWNKSYDEDDFEE